MAIWNLGSINADFVYAVPHLPTAGETLSSTGRKVFLGGKGTNMSVAAARAASRVNHIGAVGADGAWAVERLLEYGVDTRHIATIDVETAQAIIAVDASGENQIILHSGANRAIPLETLERALTEASNGDWFVCQNETSLQSEGAQLARSMGLKVAYAAAPFDAQAVIAILPYLDFIILNEVELAQLTEETGKTAKTLGIDTVVVTLGSDGSALYEAKNNWEERQFEALKVTPVDTTGAGDTFTGYVLAGLDQGQPIGQAIALATRAAALMVTRH